MCKKIWTKDKVFGESHKYDGKAQFKKKRPGAYQVARKNGGLKEMVWLKKYEPKPTRWTKDAVFIEAQKYNLLNLFSKHSGGAYYVALKKGWLEDMPWLKRKQIKRGFWKSKANVIDESHKYTSVKEFRKNCYRAYNEAKHNKWLDEMYWLEKVIWTKSRMILHGK